MQANSYLYVSSIFSSLAANMLPFALLLMAMDVSDSSALSGWVYGVMIAPVLPMGYWVGRWLDGRYWQLTFLGAHLLFPVLTLFLPLLEGLSLVSVVFLAALVSGVSRSALISGRLTLAGRINVGEDIGKATRIVNLIVVVSFGLAPLVLGAIRELWDWQRVFLCIASLNMLGGLAFLPLWNRATTFVNKDDAPWRDAFAYIRGDVFVRRLLVFFFFVYFMQGPVMTLFPKFATTHMGLGEWSRGWYLGFLGLGLFCGGLAGHVRASSQRKLTWPGGLLGMGVCVLLTAQVRNFVASALLLFAMSSLAGMLVVSVQGMLQQVVRENLRGRVNQVFQSAALHVPVISSLTLTIAADWRGIPEAISISGLCLVAFALWTWLFLTRN